MFVKLYCVIKEKRLTIFSTCWNIHNCHEKIANADNKTHHTLMHAIYRFLHLSLSIFLNFSSFFFLTSIFFLLNPLYVFWYFKRPLDICFSIFLCFLSTKIYILFSFLRASSKRNKIKLTWTENEGKKMEESQNVQISFHFPFLFSLRSFTWTICSSQIHNNSPIIWIIFYVWNRLYTKTGRNKKKKVHIVPRKEEEKLRRKDENTLILMSFSFEIHLIELGFFSLSLIHSLAQKPWKQNI